MQPWETWETSISSCHPTATDKGPHARACLAEPHQAVASATQNRDAPSRSKNDVDGLLSLSAGLGQAVLKLCRWVALVWPGRLIGADLCPPAGSAAQLHSLQIFSILSNTPGRALAMNSPNSSC